MSRIYSTDSPKNIGKKVSFLGWIHRIRELGGINFIILRDGKGLVQAVVNSKKETNKIKKINSETVVELFGKIVKEKRAPLGVEVQTENIKIISPVYEDMPVTINKKELKANIDTILDFRTLTLRHPKIKAIFKVQSEISKAFRDFLIKEGFTEIFSPKIVLGGAEGGANIFKVKYFDRWAYLTQSPQFYKQIMVGVYEKVFEVAPVFRAEPHNTSRHLNEYTSLDLEMGFIKDEKDIIKLENRLLGYMTKQLNNNCKKEFEQLGAKIPRVSKNIPILELQKAQEIIQKEYKQKCKSKLDLHPQEEKLICDYTSKKLNSEFVFITHYPTKKRPMYTMPDPKNPDYTLSFDLLFRGMEITTGGQRIHDWKMQKEKIKKEGLDPKDFSFYLDIFQYGMPPHGGLGIGLERLTMTLLGLDNIRQACLFPRDITRITP